MMNIVNGNKIKGKKWVKRMINALCFDIYNFNILRLINVLFNFYSFIEKMLTALELSEDHCNLLGPDKFATLE